MFLKLPGNTDISDISYNWWAHLNIGHDGERKCRCLISGSHVIHTLNTKSTYVFYYWYFLAHKLGGGLAGICHLISGRR